MLTLTTPLLTFGAPPYHDNLSQDQSEVVQLEAQLQRYQTNFQERREKRQGVGNAPALPFQETLLLDNQYRPDQYQYRSTYRLVEEGGLVKVQRKKVAKKTNDESNISVTTSANDLLPTQVLLGRVKAVKATENPNFSAPLKGIEAKEQHLEEEPNIWADLRNADRSNKRDSKPNLWTELTDEREASPRGLQELQMVNHNLRPRVYFLPS